MRTTNISPVLRVVLVITLCLLATGTVLGATTTTTDPMQEESQQPDTDNTVTKITLEENGDATWEIQFRTRLESEDELEAYNEFKQTFRDTKPERITSFQAGIDSVVVDAETATDREMNATDFDATVTTESLPQDWGVVTYQFTWTNFAEISNQRILMGDVFTGGYFLSTSDSLTVTAPETYTISAVEPTANTQDESTVTWQGQQDFADGEPMVQATQATDTPHAQSEESTVPWSSIAGIVGVFTALLFGGYYWKTRRTTTPDTGGILNTPSTAPTRTESDTESESTQTETDDVASTDATHTETLLSDDERVLNSLKQSGGRMKQAKIAETLEWSSSKTSRVLQRMADENQIRRLQIGRENLIDIDTDTKHD